MPSNSTDLLGQPQPDILFIIGCWEGESKRYRVFNVIEGLTDRGYSTRTIAFGDAREVWERGWRPQVAIIFRAPFDPASPVIPLLEYFRENHIRTIFDVDDYVFEPDILDRIAGIADFTTTQRAEYEWGVRAYRSLLFSCDAATVSTPYLAEKMRELGRKVAVIPNSVNRSQCDLATELRSLERPSRDTISICYFSGSRTHGRDFAECEGALLDVMGANPNVHFVLGGYLDLDSRWDAFGQRVARLPFMSPLEMLEKLSTCDINLAPLEENNPFCEGKSELKFFEAALVDTPTIASRTDSFARCIEDGRNGLLASSPSEWREKIETLIADAPLRQKMGAAARETALTDFSTARAAEKAALAYGLESIHIRPQITRHDALKIGWIVPGIIIGGGGHRNILRAAHHLESFGHDVRLYFTDTDLKDRQLRQIVNEHFYPFGGPIQRFAGTVDSEDVLMATHWTTVAPALENVSQVGEVMYFVQDFEPAFYAMGSEFIMAENTYRQGLYAITSGPWCEHLLKRDYAMEADSFRFPIDREIYWADDAVARKDRVIFFAKPDMPRRCFTLGVAALREFHKLRPETEILFFGSQSAKDHPVDFPVTYSGVLPGINDLADLYRGAAAGMVFSTTNPSLVPYEMMACGLPVVDLDRAGNEVNYDDRRDLALLADPDPRRMAAQICEMVEDSIALDGRRGRGLAFADTFPTEIEMARRIESLIQMRLSKQGSGKKSAESAQAAAG